MKRYLVVLVIPDEIEGGLDDVTDAIDRAHEYMHALGSGEAPYLEVIADDNLV